MREAHTVTRAELVRAIVWARRGARLGSELEIFDFGHFSPFLAGFWPVMALVSVSKALNENISPHYDWIEFEQQKKIE